MVALCFYFQVHQPFRIKHYRIRQIGSHTNYFNDALNESVFHKVATNCYWPAGELIFSLLKKFPQDFSVTFSLSGTFLEQCERFEPALLDLYKRIFECPNADILCETSHHSLAVLKDTEEFSKQVKIQRKRLKSLFQREPVAFRNTELIYSDFIGEKVADLGFKGCLHEGWDPIIPEGWNAHHLFGHPTRDSLKLLPKSYHLSDDIAFRFSDRGWASWPLTADKYINWLERLQDGKHEFIGLFMDYETFGEHQWKETGIFEFFSHLVEGIIRHQNFEFTSVTQALERFPARGVLHAPTPLSWADSERDITAWLGNSLQEEAFTKVYALKKLVHQTFDIGLLEEWRKLQTSDHFYYICIKYSHDGDVHKYFSPFSSPYDAYLDFMNILHDFEIKCQALAARQGRGTRVAALNARRLRVPRSTQNSA